jgi:hypothetical protein
MTRLSRWALVTGAAGVWLAWWLMPDAATNDAAQILAAVAPHRASVQLSALVQLAGAALLVPGLVAEAAPGRRARAGALAMLWGTLGMAADAVYHQLAYEMTAPSVAAASMLPVMTKMQTDQLRPLVPLLLAFVAGAPLLGWQLSRRGGAGVWAPRLLIAPLFTIPIGLLAVQLAAAPRRVVVLIVLAEICAGLAVLGITRSDDRATEATL